MSQKQEGISNHLYSQQVEEGDYEEEEPLPFDGIEKSAVLAQCRDFNAISLDVRKCMINMTKVLYLVNNGCSFSAAEATDVFFASTKMFQNADPKLRRLLFVFLKDLSTYAEQVFIASSSLVKDINGDNETNKCNAIRTLRKISDATMIGTMERYLRQAVVDRNNNVVSAAIVTGIHMAHVVPDTVKGWADQVNEALKNRGSKAQYHALALLHKLRKNDRMSVLRLVQQAQSGSIRSPLATCLLIRMCAEPLQEDFQNNLDLYRWLTTNQLNHPTDTVVLEAAQLICSLRNVTAKEVAPAVLSLSPFLGSHKPTIRYMCISLLNKVSAQHPTAVAPISSEIEALVTDHNRSISTLAITTMLKIGNEFSIDRLLRQLTGPMMSDMSDESRSVVIDSMRVIAGKYPSKYPIILDFLLTALRTDGSNDLAGKNSVIETVVYISQSNPAAKETVLTALAKFIDDCEYTSLIKRVLCLIGEEGPTSANPKQFIRYICNHVSLESPIVRAVAVTTLAKFAAQVPDLRPSITVLLKRAMSDPDDEVRDRAVFYYRLYSTANPSAISHLVTDVTTAVNKDREKVVQKPAIVRELEEAAPAAAAEAASRVQTVGGGVAQISGPSATVLALRDKLKRIEQLKALGEPCRTTDPVPLTEPDNEYVVSVAKHLYPDHAVLQFKIQSTMENVTMHNFNILADTDDVEGAVPTYAIPVPIIPPGETAYAYVVLQYEENAFPMGLVRCGCSFAMQEEGDDIGDAEEYPLDEFAINACDYIHPVDLGGPDRYESQFIALKDEETVDTYSLRTMKNLTVAAHAVIDFFGMHIEGGKPEKITTKSHVVNMSGVLANRNKDLVMVSAKVFIAADNTVALQLTQRGATSEIRQFLSTALMS